MSVRTRRSLAIMTGLVAAMLVFSQARSEAAIDGIVYTPGVPIAIRAKADHVQMPDGGALLMWGYTDGARAQYPGPTLIVNEGDVVEIKLINDLSVATSIIFPGQEVVTAIGGLAGRMTHEAPPDGTTAVTYSFTAAHPGTYLYQSGTRPELQTEMGLFGALIVRPSIGGNHAYNHADSAYTREYLQLFSEMDPYIHYTVEDSGVAALDSTDLLADYFPNYWFLNGRAAVDTLLADHAPWLPTQPYSSLYLMHPGEKTLIRTINAGRDPHPQHPHGNHMKIIARDGRLLESSPGAGADLAVNIYTFNSVPGQTIDSIWEWTGKNLGWDIYGTPADGLAHDCTDSDGDDFDDATYEFCPDHYKPFPVAIPEGLDLTFGGLWSGSPFLGQGGSLPPGEGGLNPFAGYPFIWHSHSEKEISNFDIFPGGILTFMFVVDWTIALP